MRLHALPSPTPQTPLLLFITLVTFWLPIVIAIPPAALLLPLGTFLLLCFSTMRKLRGDPYWGVVLWVQRLHILTQYVQFGAGRVQGREAYKVRGQGGPRGSRA
jgi:hypothetical protein